MIELERTKDGEIKRERENRRGERDRERERERDIRDTGKNQREGLTWSE